MTGRDEGAQTVRVKVPKGLTIEAEEKYADCVIDFGLALARETSRLEEAERDETLERPEITSTMVVKANDAVRNPRIESPPPIPPWPIVAQIVAFAAGIAAGVFGSYLNSTWQWWAMLGAGAVGVGAQTYAIVALRRRG